MKKFIINITFLCSVILFFVVSIVLATKVIINHYKCSIPLSKNILLIGDSHIEVGIDDSVYECSYNIARSGTGYLYNYLILQNILKQNNHIDTVLLTCYHYSMNEVKDADYMKEFDIYGSWLHLSYLMSTTECRDALDMPIIQELKYLFTASKVLFDVLPKPIYGGYIRSNRNQLYKDIESSGPRIKENELTTSYLFKDGVNYKYLHKIKALCDEHGIRLILFNVPTYRADIHTNEIVFNNDMEELSRLGFEYLDFSHFPLDDSCYGDITHINAQGAKIFSEYLQEKGLIPFD